MTLLIEREETECKVIKLPSSPTVTGMCLFILEGVTQYDLPSNFQLEKRFVLVPVLVISICLLCDFIEQETSLEELNWGVADACQLTKGEVREVRLY